MKLSAWPPPHEYGRFPLERITQLTGKPSKWLPRRTRVALRSYDAAAAIVTLAGGAFLIFGSGDALKDLLFLGLLGASTLFTWKRPKLVNYLTTRALASGAYTVGGLASLGDAAPRGQVRITGEVRARGSHLGASDGRSVVYRRVAIGINHQILSRHVAAFVYEAGCDFDLVDDAGHAAEVQVSAAEVIGPNPVPPHTRSQDLRAGEAAPEAHLPLLELVPEAARAKIPAKAIRWVAQAEFTLRDGDRVEVYASASTTADPGAPAIGRETPSRPVLTAGQIPLVIVAVRS